MKGQDKQRHKSGSDGCGVCSTMMCDVETERPQRVKVNGVLSKGLLSFSGARQGCVLSPLLFALYRNSCQSRHPGHKITRFADEPVILSLVNF